MTNEVYQALSTYALKKNDIDLKLSLGIPPRHLRLDAGFTTPIAKLYQDRQKMMTIYKTSSGVAWSSACRYTPTQQTIVELWPFKNNSLGLVINTRREDDVSCFGPIDYHTGIPLNDDDFLFLPEW